MTDVIEGRVGEAVARFHLAPGVEAQASPGGLSGKLRAPDGRTIGWSSSHPARLEASEWRPQFGVRQASRQLRISLFSDRLQTVFSW